MTQHHIVPKSVYVTVFLSLLALTGLTTAIAFVDLGPLNTPIALTIAIAKAVLVVLFFMHVRYSERLIWVFAGGGLLWLMLLIGLTMSDFLTRSWWIKLPVMNLLAR